MATIHITEIQKILQSRGMKDAAPFNESEGYFLEIRFDSLTGSPSLLDNHVDEELSNRVITANSAYGIVTIQFDEFGDLRCIDLS